MKEFKIGDRVAILGTITSTTGGGEYSIIINVDNSTEILDCTREGKYHKHDTQQNVRHLEDLQYMYGKEMYVSAIPDKFTLTGYVIGKSNTGAYMFIEKQDIERFKQRKTVPVQQAMYVAEIEAIPRNLIKERDELLNKLADIIIEIQQSKI